jgi:negative regulator of genetic competence, sporulation and motility
LTQEVLKDLENLNKKTLISLNQKNKSMSTFLERIHEEKDQLKEKLDKLDDFIENNLKFNELSNIQRILLVNQFNAMKMYFYALSSRVEYIND